MSHPLEPGAADELSRALGSVVLEPRLTTALRRAEDLRWAATRTLRPEHDARRLADVLRDGDDVSAIAALHALGAVPSPVADEALLDTVVGASSTLAAHAAWVLAARRSSPAAVAALIRLVADGGFTAMLAERTLLEWARFGASATIAAVEAARPTHGEVGRRRLDALRSALADGPEPWSPRSLEHLRRPGGDGLVVIQPFLHARLDRAGTALGAGDAGGIASLLRSLGSALAGVHDVDDVITVTRRHPGEAPSEVLAPGHCVERVDVGPPGALPWRESWAHRTQVERHLVAMGAALDGRRVVWHLRMADVGTLAAAGAARQLGQAVVFTAAPDPHIVIDALQDSGRLHRSTFGVEDGAAQYWFRARMVERLTAQADRLVLLPRPTIEDELVDLLGVERAELAARARTVAEGVDVAEVGAARARLARRPVPEAAAAVLASLPPERRGLPWLLTVGRLHPAKGPQRIVEAVAADPGLPGEVNVVVVGGDLEHPSPDEQSTIERVRQAAAGAAPGLVTFTGHLPPAAVADLMAHMVARGGVYVCASDKEEFGLAIVEALAAGAVVVAPERGGPRTYVVAGDTGVLCDTLSVDALREAIVTALALRARPGRAERARELVRRELGVEQMADRLGEVYRELLRSPVPA